MAESFVLAIDQGTTSTRAGLYDKVGRCVGSAGRDLRQHYPKPGWVEHDADEIWQAVEIVVAEAMQAARMSPSDVIGIGITNQRETVVLWDKKSGTPVAPAIVWQDRRTSDFCRTHQKEEPWIFRRTGLVLDPYFSATKIRWLLEQDSSWREQAQGGNLLAGTIDTWLIWRLTGGKSHLTDVTNASRTLLFNIESAGWDDDLCRFFDVPRSLLPDVRRSGDDFGQTRGLSFLPDGLPITGVAGDQQAALFGQGGFKRGDAKCTYGTGAFFLEHTGEQLILSEHRLLSSLAAMIDDRKLYVLEGSVFIAGAAVQWLRDGLKLFDASPEVERLAMESDLHEPVLFVPGFVGLGAPYWAPEVRGALFGLTRNTTGNDLARAALEGVAFQIADLVEAAGQDTGQKLTSLRVDGGMARNGWFLQCQADILGFPVVQTPTSEATSLGAAYLAGLQAGLWSDIDALSQLTQSGRHFEPRLDEQQRRRRLRQWHEAVDAVIRLYSSEK